MGRQIGIIGGGAAGFFAAITAAEAARDATVTIYEATAHLLAKVKVSGGGRCNVTHACFEPRDLVKKYPRGSRELLGAFALAAARHGGMVRGARRAAENRSRRTDVSGHGRIRRQS